jgi:hypothetical protein
MKSIRQSNMFNRVCFADERFENLLCVSVASSIWIANVTENDHVFAAQCLRVLVTPLASA